MSVATVCWEDGALRIIDQTRLPAECVEIPLETVEAVWDAIKRLKVRGAPAIGVTAAFGVLVALQQKEPDTASGVIQTVREAADYLGSARPTAVNLFWALDRMKRVAEAHGTEQDTETLMDRLEAEAAAIWEEDRRLCRAIGEHGARLIRDGDGVLTYCNAGGLATADYGTALGVLFRARELGRVFSVYAAETRPLLQGARLTAWELMRAGIDTTLICDNMVGAVMQSGRIQRVVVGADRIAANGDTANKIGTYSVAALAHAHDIPFYVAAPFSSFDLACPSGSEIPIEERPEEEVTHFGGQQTAPDGVKVYNPAFDVTPHELIGGIVTECGILLPPFEETIKACT